MLKLEVGKTYLTHKGIKYQCVSIKHPGAAHDDPYCCTVLNCKQKGLNYTDINGLVSINHDLDLVKEYKEPKIHKRDIVWWCNNSDRAIYSSIIEVGKRLNFGALDAKELHRETVSYTEES